METVNVRARDPPPPKPFFDHLNYDVRVLIYKEMMLPPLSDECVGFMLSCRQAKQEIDELRGEVVKRYLERFEKDFTAAIGTDVPVSITSDNTKSYITIRLGYNSMTLRSPSIKVVIDALLPLLRTRFSRVTVTFNLGCRRQLIMPSFGARLGLMFLCASLSKPVKEDAAVPEDGGIIVDSEKPPPASPIGVKHIGLGIEFNPDDEDSLKSTYGHALRGSQYTCSEQLRQLWLRKYPEHRDEVSHNNWPFIYNMVCSCRRKSVFGLFSPTRWTALNVKAVNHIFDRMRSGERDENLIMSRSCLSLGVGDEIVAYRAADPVCHRPFF
jgi:hypothetical protein